MLPLRCALILSVCLLSACGSLKKIVAPSTAATQSSINAAKGSVSEAQSANTKAQAANARAQDRAKRIDDKVMVIEKYWDSTR